MVAIDGQLLGFVVIGLTFNNNNNKIIYFVWWEKFRDNIKLIFYGWIGYIFPLIVKKEWKTDFAKICTKIEIKMPEIILPLRIEGDHIIS